MNVFSVDAETDGLYGHVWAIGAVVLDGADEVARFAGQLDPDDTRFPPFRRGVTDPWVREHIVPVVDLPRFASHRLLIEAFWGFWMEHRESSIAVADFGAPVEAGLFRVCVAQDEQARMFQGPYPLHELGTALLLAGLDPDCDRRGMSGRLDLVPHDPVDDALASGLCWQMIAAGGAAYRPRYASGA